LLGAEAKTFQIKSLEGYLFPETYMMTKYMGTKELVSQMVKRFLLNWDTIEKKYERQKVLFVRDMVNSALNFSWLNQPVQWLFNFAK
jgi:cell division protein YceG involved in septum cleavage